MQPTQETLDFIDLLSRNLPDLRAGATVDDLRSAISAATAVDGPDVAVVRDLSCPGPAGPVPLRHYRPVPDTIAPGIVFFHGGGFATGDLDTHDHICRIIAAGTGAAVVAVDYRLAPEHPFPAAPDDAFAATRWVAENAEELGIDAGRLAVAGDSAGGCLAAVVAQLARDAGGPAIAYQALVYPVVDWDDTAARELYPSRTGNGDSYFLTAEAMSWFGEQYIADPSDRTDVRASPIRAASLAGLPPALVLTADFDPLRDEGEAYARALAAAGVATTTVRINDGFHGILGFGAFLNSAERAETALVSALRAALADAS
ncbi:acetyl esterase [Nocardiopsis mwathae]|uniref:Acetyl esterase n=1 Tax=Nocardiopsis mwathae TaxID=1472723 RepID=A0A7W9YHK8_9ACTN|nr:alpha/beta hydrolase [Nocardiopsis mwathae]MBB6172298.1 acetyl esterase [Nocardiopsis mwathae]